MSTLATADLTSDSENDGDFVPTSPKRKNKSSKNGPKKVKRVKVNNGEGPDNESITSSSSSSSSGSDDAEEDREEDKEKREQIKLNEIEERKRRAKEEFDKMKAELNSTSGTKETNEKEVEMIDIQRARRFAGETIYETVKIRKDDPEAIAYLAKQSEPEGQGEKQSVSMEGELSSNVSGIPVKEGDSTVPLSSSNQSTKINSTSPIIPPPNPITSITPRPKGPPIRRKPRQSLESMSAALDKGKKMTTLEKSQMDWKSHTTQTKGLQDELSSNRKNGSGYLDKKDFLDRVGERRSNTFDSNR
ncbi:uncharacterized protein L201_002427 [Kwoniella dendrophila CBS 6074]|uniref:SWR1-complex protein 5 n=1 Tax=Kwoniella dendrophila CBS 6074 TaxID=1295534 RepID=A0AAX4JSD5_9TREE